MGHPVLITALIALAVAVAWLIARFEAYCLADLRRAQDRELRCLTRQAWTMLILLWIPFGGMAYLAYGKVR